METPRHLAEHPLNMERMRLRNSALAVLALSLGLPGVSHAQGEEGDCLYDNGPWDGNSSAYFSAVDLDGDGAIGVHHVLDDFPVPDGERWIIKGFRFTVVAFGDGNTTQATLSIREDKRGEPGDVIVDGVVTSFQRETTGIRGQFGLPEEEVRLELEPICLGPGKYWFQVSIDQSSFDIWEGRQEITCSRAWVLDDGVLHPSCFNACETDVNFKITGDRSLGTNYCDAIPNSTGQPGKLLALGSLDVVDNDLRLLAKCLPVDEFGYAINSMNNTDVIDVPNGGKLCIGPSNGRHNRPWIDDFGVTDGAGQLETKIDLTNMPWSDGPPRMVMAGDTWYFQIWYRDGDMSNFTEAISITFNP